MIIGALAERGKPSLRRLYRLFDAYVSPLIPFWSDDVTLSAPSTPISKVIKSRDTTALYIICSRLVSILSRMHRECNFLYQRLVFADKILLKLRYLPNELESNYARCWASMMFVFSRYRDSFQGGDLDKIVRQSTNSRTTVSSFA